MNYLENYKLRMADLFEKLLLFFLKTTILKGLNTLISSQGETY